MEKLYLIWYEEEQKILNIIGELDYLDGKYIFKYLNYENSDLQLFSKNGLYYGFEDINKTYESNELFPTIYNRLPSKKREDYKYIMREYGLLDSDDDFQILKKTKGKLSTDYFIFVTEDCLGILKKYTKY